ncbi:hypothetical protein CBI38_23805 [Rhodococcus oxybenzonivorans]|uniref:Lipoprotein n=1 Tax=Rhodococcus oxybenzonivorans TaxID=1990687 RepID=A0A2S2BZX3_9NOCA|nr:MULTISPECIES: hypothetical protein [Rhodococcus]AWK74123.1 hypothetical protein CBI38_23805 [Rhodococcus oxybenzonivorans]QTJ68138.1 hypothetical protein HYG77_22885 [Rhodococcus sp. ZPP]
MRQFFVILAAALIAMAASIGSAGAAPAAPATSSTTATVTPDTADSAGLIGPASAADAATAAPSAAGSIIVRTIRECGIGALVGKTTDELTLQNVVVFVNAVGQRLAAVAAGPLAIITVAAYGCIDRALTSLRPDSGER